VAPRLNPTVKRIGADVSMPDVGELLNGCG
jgi:hypothetical protein